jgi:hypothetical protein
MGFGYTVDTPTDAAIACYDGNWCDGRPFGTFEPN